MIAIGVNPLSTGSPQAGNADIHMYEFRTDADEAIQALLGAVDRFETDGSIRSEGTAESLRALLTRAEAEISAGDNDAAIWSLTRFIDHIGRQTPRNITESAAQTLIRMVRQA
jgi:hypothetical protein